MAEITDFYGSNTPKCPKSPCSFQKTGCSFHSFEPILSKRAKKKSLKNLDFSGFFGGELGIRTLGSFWEHSISSAAPSTSRTTLHKDSPRRLLGFPLEILDIKGFSKLKIEYFSVFSPAFLSKNFLSIKQTEIYTEGYRSGHNGADSKSVVRLIPDQGFESLTLRHRKSL